MYHGLLDQTDRLKSKLQAEHPSVEPEPNVFDRPRRDVRACIACLGGRVVDQGQVLVSRFSQLPFLLVLLAAAAAALGSICARYDMLLLLAVVVTS